jgi:large conductance mechanosensitive channel
MWQDFKAFIMRGNLLELAVAFIMGVAFAGVVTAFTKVILGVISFIFGGNVSFDGLGVERDGVVVIPYGALITQVVNFLIIAVALFLIVKAVTRFMRKDATTKSCDFCKTDIPLAATRCPNCTSQLATT